MKLYKVHLFIIVVALAVSSAGCVFEDFSEVSTDTVAKDGGSSDTVENDGDSSDAADISCGLDASSCPDEPGAVSECKRGQCKYQCQSTFDDGDNDPSNGCEIDTSSIETCGETHKACPSNNFNHRPTCRMNPLSGTYECGVDETECKDGFENRGLEGCVASEGDAGEGGEDAG
jgi:hypothetical protein